MFDRKNLFKACFLFVIAMVWMHPALSHGNHGQPLTDEQAVEQATKDVSIIVQQSEQVEGQTLNASWMAITDKKISKKSLKYVIVSFRHPEQDKTLYILLDIYGEYLGANFSGEFKGV